jgi:predicted kinase
LVKPRCIQLIGVPGSGKSTWIKKQIWALGLTVVSTDPFVEDYARSQGKTYTEVFEEYMPMAIELMINQVIHAREHNHTIIWDQTSTTVASRLKKFKMLPDYEHIAVVFKTPDSEELQRRLSNRPGKIIPEDVVNNMIKNFEEPSFYEGFTIIMDSEHNARRNKNA